MTSQERDGLLHLKIQIDARIGVLKSQIAEAKRTFTATGRRANYKEFCSWEKELRDLGAESQSVQFKLKKLNDSIRAANRERFENRFVEVARNVLDPETFEKIMSRVSLEN